MFYFNVNSVQFNSQNLKEEERKKNTKVRSEVEIKCEKSNENSGIKKVLRQMGRYMYVLNRVKSTVYLIFSEIFQISHSMMNEEKLGWGIKMETRKGSKGI